MSLLHIFYVVVIFILCRCFISFYVVVTFNYMSLLYFVLCRCEIILYRCRVQARISSYFLKSIFNIIHVEKHVPTRII